MNRAEQASNKYPIRAYFLPFHPMIILDGRPPALPSPRRHRTPARPTPQSPCPVGVPRERKQVMKAPKVLAASLASVAALCLAGGLAFALEPADPATRPMPEKAQDTSITKQVEIGRAHV